MKNLHLQEWPVGEVMRFGYHGWFRFSELQISSDVCFHSLTFLDSKKDSRSTSHHSFSSHLPTFGQPLGKWVTRCRNQSLFHILLKALFPTQTTSIPSTTASHSQKQVKCISCGISTPGCCLTASSRQPQLTCSLCLNKGVSVQH